MLLFLFAIPGLAAPVEPPLPWTKLGAKSYTLTVESARDAPGLDVSRSVTTPLTMRTVSRGDAEGVVRWEFGPATVEGDECEQDWLDIQLALAPGVVRPAIEMRIEDFGGLVEVVNRKAALDAFLRILDEHPQPACVDVQPSDWVEEVESLQGRTLAGSAVELFLMLLGAPLDTEEPTVYEDSLEQHISMVDVPARAEWRVVAHDARTVTVAWSRTAHPDAGAKALRRAADDLVARGGTITKAEAAIPGYVGATEKAELVIDRKSGWPTKLSYERMEHIGMYKVFSRVRFVAR
ncbi:MAG TPA: hypothetical protein VFL14_00015 [Xanthomonadales bacterium]|nr:hypothetical protein [Xanthomonadales bacterium]